jgi:hypothetical protein
MCFRARKRGLMYEKAEFEWKGFKENWNKR